MNIWAHTEIRGVVRRSHRVGSFSSSRRRISIGRDGRCGRTVGGSGIAKLVSVQDKLGYGCEIYISRLVTENEL